MSRPPRLSVLDQIPVISGHSVADAVAATVDLARAAEQLGYSRYWCAEHHGLRSVANPAPEVVLARLGSVTRHIRLGSGGVMLPYYSPFKVAEQFLMLEALFPGRIDLAVGRAPGGDMVTARAVGYGRFDSDRFPEQVSDLVALFSGRIPAEHYAHGLVLHPAIAGRPELWILGSSDFGAGLAAHLGIRFAFAHFINPLDGPAVMRAYRTHFQAGVEAQPHSALAVFAICVERADQVEPVLRAVDLRRLHMALGANMPIPTIEEARDFQFGERERRIVEGQRPRSVIGTPEEVAEKILAIQAASLADEIVVLTVAPSYALRLRSYELLARAFALESRPDSVTDCTA